MCKRKAKYNNDEVYLVGTNIDKKQLWLYPLYEKGELLSLCIVLFTSHDRPSYSKDYDIVHMADINSFYNPLYNTDKEILMMMINALKTNKKSDLEGIINMFKPRKYIKNESSI